MEDTKCETQGGQTEINLLDLSLSFLLTSMILSISISLSRPPQYLLKYEAECVPGPEICRTVEEECPPPVCQTHYETVEKRVCSPVSDEICTTSYQEQCRTEPRENCGEGGEGEVCSTVYDIVSNIQCSQIEEKQCRTFYVPECETVQGP